MVHIIWFPRIPKCFVSWDVGYPKMVLITWFPRIPKYLVSLDVWSVLGYPKIVPPIWFPEIPKYLTYQDIWDIPGESLGSLHSEIYRMFQDRYCLVSVSSYFHFRGECHKERAVFQSTCGFSLTKKLFLAAEAPSDTAEWSPQTVPTSLPDLPELQS